MCVLSPPQAGRERSARFACLAFIFSLISPSNVSANIEGKRLLSWSGFLNEAMIPIWRVLDEAIRFS